jgi:Ala-tRNA(Pro) deacylase
MKHTPDMLFELLTRLAIKSTTYQHPPVNTIEEALALAPNVPQPWCKNLFLKDKNDAVYLLVALASSQVQLNALAKQINAPGLRFAPTDVLETYLQVQPGEVSPFALINDQEHKVVVLIDEALLAQVQVGFHPLTNTATTVITPHDLQTFLCACGNPVHYVSFAH